MQEQPIKVWDLPVTDGAFLKADVPYETHRRGKNWMAVITRDPKSPGGLRREFLGRGRGPYAYLADDIPEGSALEIGADYYSGGGNPSRGRRYYLLLKKSDTAWTLAKYETPARLFAAQKEWRPLVGDSKPDHVRLITLPEREKEEVSNSA